MLDWELILSNKYAIICFLVSSLSKIEIVSKICNKQYSPYSFSLCLSDTGLYLPKPWDNKIQNIILETFLKYFCQVLKYFP